MALPPFGSSSYGLLAIGVLLFSFSLYRYLLPKPIPGIPYNKHAARRLLGDMPEFGKSVNDTKEVNKWLVDQCRAHNSAICQVFVRPFAKPWVVICDYREAQDIMSRRVREFDRSKISQDSLKTVSPHFQLCLATNDEWRSNRKLMNDTMSTPFLSNVVGPIMHSIALDLMDLWRHKIRLSKGHPFSAFDDVFKGALDIICQATFGVKVGAIRRQIDLLSETIQVPLDSDPQVAAVLPAAEDPEFFNAILKISATVEWALKLPFSHLVHRFILNFVPSAAKAIRVKDQTISDELQAAFDKFSQTNTKKQDVTSALELIVMKEFQAAAKEGRQARPDTPQLRDELYGFILGGHETSSTAIVWTLKLLARHQNIQDKFRAALHEYHPRAKRDGDQPTVEEIINPDQPYTDALIEECLRVAGVLPVMARDAMVDTEVLGYAIPKGTQIFMAALGPDFIETPIPVPETSRSASSQASKEKNGTWDPQTISEFQPDRWLTCSPDDGGKMVFNPRAGQSFPFGGGIRSCFGRKMAYLELRVLLTLIVWNFKLEPVPLKYDTWAARDSVTHAPQETYVKLVEIVR